MIRKQSHDGAGLSPVQRKACIVLALCVLAVVLSFVGAWILPQALGLSGSKDAYDPDLYPLDTSLECILGDASTDDSYITQSLFVGDRAALSLQKDSRVTLNQYAGKDDLKVSSFLKESCVAFADDSNNYTIPQAVAQETADRMIDLGIRGVWNFTNIELSSANPDVKFENIHFADSLLTLSYRIANS